MYHGQIKHGIQLQDPKLKHEPTSYYGRESGAGIALRHHPKRYKNQPLEVGAVGLGAGTIASYLRP